MYIERGFTRLACGIQSVQFSSGCLALKVQNLFVVLSMSLDVSAVSFWNWIPRGFLESSRIPPLESQRKLLGVKLVEKCHINRVNQAAGQSDDKWAKSKVSFFYVLLFGPTSEGSTQIQDGFPVSNNLPQEYPAPSGLGNSRCSQIDNQDCSYSSLKNPSSLGFFFMGRLYSCFFLFLIAYYRFLQVVVLLAGHTHWTSFLLNFPVFFWGGEYTSSKCLPVIWISLESISPFVNLLFQFGQRFVNVVYLFKEMLH